MGASPQPAKYEDRYYNVSIRILGKEKNALIDYAKEQQVSVSELIEYAIWTFIREKKNIPNPGPSQFHETTPQDTIRAYLTGVNLLEPCGKPSCEKEIVTVAGMNFCTTCNVRVS